MLESGEAPVEDEPVDDGQAVAPESGTSESETPGWETPEIDDVPEEYRERISEIERGFKSQYTKKTQELAQERERIQAQNEQLEFVEKLNNDPEFQLAVLKELAAQQGYELPEDEAEEEVEDGGEEFRDPRLDALLEQLEAQETEAAQEQYLNTIQEHMDDELARLAKKHGREFSEEEEDVICSYAIATASSDQDFPDIEAAFNRLAGIEQGWKKRYIDSKKAPYVANGTSGSESESYDFNDRAQRVAHMAEVAQAHAAQQNT